MPHKNKADYNAYMRVYMLRRYHERRDNAIALLGGKCVVCGSTNDLELDHINPADKSFDVGKLWSCKKSVYDGEVQKCQLLCNDHHKNKHASNHPHGTPQRYWSGCKCRPCTEAVNLHSREYRRKVKLSES